jgi:multicomponent K+:H+ antiporter subunit D
LSHLIVYPVLLPLLAGTLLLLLRRALPLKIRRWINLAAVAAQIALAALILRGVSGGEILVYALGNWPAPYGIVLVADRLAAWMLVITSSLALFALLYAVRGTDRGSRHFHPLFQLQLFGLNGAFLTGDIFNLFVFFEILLLASYGLLLHRGGPWRTRAGLHFVVVNLAGSTLFLFAAGTLYGSLGTLNMADLAVKAAETPSEDLGLVRAAGLLLFGVFALKAALVPLHLWLPAAYSSTTAPVAALFAIMTKVGAYCVLRVGTLMFGPDAGPVAGLYADWLLPLALLTMGLGALGALSATGLRRQVAYLVVVSVGLLLTAFGSWDQAGIASGLYYLAHSTLAIAAFFLLADVIARGRGERSDRLNPGPEIARAGLVGGLFFVTAVLVAGLPPLSGFIGKVLVLRAALPGPAGFWVLGLVLTTGLMGVIALARSGSVLFFSTQDRIEPQPAGGVIPALVPVIGLLALCLVLTVWASPVSRFAEATASQVLEPQAYVRAVLGVDAADDTR